MKKIVSVVMMLAIALACTLALCSCGETPPPEDDEPTPYAEGAADFITAIANTSYTSVATTVTVTMADIELETVYTTVYAQDGTSVMTYSVERIPASDSQEDFEVVTGTVNFDAQGNVTSGEMPAEIAGNVAFDADSDKITEYTVVDNRLTVKVAQADTLSVIGYALASDAVITVTLNGTSVSVLTLGYKTADNATVNIVSVYN